MLEKIDLEAKVSKADYRQAMDALDVRLAELQRGVQSAGIPVVVVMEGWDAAGKGAALSRVLQALDPRHFKVHNVRPPTDYERMFPRMHRFWQMLPAYGNIAIYNHSWYRLVFDERVAGEVKPAVVREAFEDIRVFERQLAADGAAVVKFFLHIAKEEQAKRFAKLSKDKAFAWKIGEAERFRHKRYDTFYAAVEDALVETSAPHAPWSVVPATNERYCKLRIAETLVATFEQALEQHSSQLAPVIQPAPRRTNPLQRIDLDLSIDDETYEKKRDKLQKEVRRLQHLCYMRRTSVVIVFEGPDAAGKGGAIRRLVREMDPRGYEVVPVAAPAGDEKTHHYLWRFWKGVPKAGHITIFDRSWYGRVLVERIEGFAEAHEWVRAYREINEFEEQLSEYGTVVVKFWVHISKEEQLRRFKERQNDPHKQWKINDEDWRNRKKWKEYEEAAADMLERTSTVHAPWTIVEGNDKHYARVKVLQVVAERLKHAVDP